MATMTDRTYARATNAFVLLAVASAFLFESSGRYQVMVGMLGALAGVGAIAVYFRRDSERDRELAAAKTPEPETREVQTPSAIVSSMTGRMYTPRGRAPRLGDLDPFAIEWNRYAKVQLHGPESMTLDFLAGPDEEEFYRAVGLFLRGLSTIKRGHYELELTRHGHLTKAIEPLFEFRAPPSRLLGIGP